MASHGALCIDCVGNCDFYGSCVYRINTSDSWDNMYQQNPSPARRILNTWTLKNIFTNNSVMSTNLAWNRLLLNLNFYGERVNENKERA